MTQIGILGCGWLGLPLAKALIENNLSVKGSTIPIEKLSVLDNTGIQSCLVAPLENKNIGNIQDFRKIQRL